MSTLGHDQNLIAQYQKRHAMQLTMLRQIALFLLALCLTVPAVAAPVCSQPAPCDMAAMAQAGPGHHAPSVPGDQHRDAPMTVDHLGCIGCAMPMPSSALAPRDALVPLAAHTPAMPALVALVSAPDLPPPRA